MSSPDPKPTRAEAIDDRDARLEFRIAVLATDGRCVVHDDPADCEGDPQAHHVVTRQQLRKAGRLDLEWDPRNGATVCGDVAHRRHTLALERIPFAKLPQRCIDFAREYGFEAVLDRFYSGVVEQTP